MKKSEAAAVKTRSQKANEPLDTRERILFAALRLFRKRGFHGTGLADILETAQAPKGSLYHHFPGGKEEIGVAVVAEIAKGIIGLLNGSRARCTEAVIIQAGEQLAQTIERTNHEICTLFTAFLAERSESPKLGHAVALAYDQMIDALVMRLVADGIAPKIAKEKASTVVMLLEGGAMIAQAQQSVRPFRLAVKHAALLCVTPDA
jgi:TetR/AcrR family transcriptional regulator, lmrAB and yxaGH operons repressor